MLQVNKGKIHNFFLCIIFFISVQDSYCYTWPHKYTHFHHPHLQRHRRFLQPNRTIHLLLAGNYSFTLHSPRTQLGQQTLAAQPSHRAFTHHVAVVSYNFISTPRLWCAHRCAAPKSPAFAQEDQTVVVKRPQRVCMCVFMLWAALVLKCLYTYMFDGLEQVYIYIVYVL